MICEHFARTRIKLPAGHKVEAECRVCPLREESGDCIKDIYQDMGEQTEKRTAEIWRKFYERNHT